ncbi:MAG: hypothetical protein RLZZ444_4633, partial [Pseudomonadota bacterium]
MPEEKDFRKIDLNLLLVFEAIYKSRNISQAAIQLGMTQPTMSNALARLRAQLGDQLFVRLDRGVAPTTYAENIILPIRNALSMLRNGLHPQSAFDFTHTKRTFRLAMHGFPTATLLPPLLDELDKQAPGIGIEIIKPDWSQPFDVLLRGEADLAIDAFPVQHPQIHFDPLFNLQIVAIARRGHPVIDGSLSRQQFSEVGQIALDQGARRRVLIESVLMSFGITRRVVCEASSTGEFAPIVARTDLIALVPLRFARAVERGFDLQVLQLPFRFPMSKLMMGWPYQREHDSGLAWLRSRLHQAAIVTETPFLPPHPDWGPL